MPSYTGIQVRKQYQALTDEEINTKHRTDITHQLVLGLKPSVAMALALQAEKLNMKPVVMARDILETSLQGIILHLNTPMFGSGNPEEQLNRLISTNPLIGNNRGIYGGQKR